MGLLAGGLIVHADGHREAVRAPALLELVLDEPKDCRHWIHGMVHQTQISIDPLDQPVLVRRPGFQYQVLDAILAWRTATGTLPSTRTELASEFDKVRICPPAYGCMLDLDRDEPTVRISYDFDETQSHSVHLQID